MTAIINALVMFSPIVLMGVAILIADLLNRE